MGRFGSRAGADSGQETSQPPCHLSRIGHVFRDAETSAGSMAVSWNLRIGRHSGRGLRLDRTAEKAAEILVKVLSMGGKKQSISLAGPMLPTAQIN